VTELLANWSLIFKKDKAWYADDSRISTDLLEEEEEKEVVSSLCFFSAQRYDLFYDPV